MFQLCQKRQFGYQVEREEKCSRLRKVDDGGLRKEANIIMDRRKSVTLSLVPLLLVLSETKMARE